MFAEKGWQEHSPVEEIGSVSENAVESIAEGTPPRARNASPSRGSDRLLLIGFACALVFIFMGDMEDPTGTGACVLSAILPIVALAFVTGTFRDRRPAQRALMWFLAALFATAAGAVFSIGASAQLDIGPGAGGFLFLAFCAPPALLLFVASLYFLRKAWPQLRVALQAEREELALQVIETRGEVSFEDLARELGMHEAQVSDLVQSVLSGDQSKGTSTLATSGCTLRLVWPQCCADCRA